MRKAERSVSRVTYSLDSIHRPATKHKTVKWLFVDRKAYGKTRNVKLT